MVLSSTSFDYVFYISIYPAPWQSFNIIKSKICSLLFSSIVIFTYEADKFVFRRFKIIIQIPRICLAKNKIKLWYEHFNKIIISFYFYVTDSMMMTFSFHWISNSDIETMNTYSILYLINMKQLTSMLLFFIYLYFFARMIKTKSKMCWQ